VDEIVENVIATTTKIRFINIALQEARPWMTKVETFSTQTVADQQLYNLPTGVKVSDILPEGVYLTQTTYNTTTVVSSTLFYNKYKLRGRLCPLEGSQFFEYTTQLGISPVPDDVVYLKVMYRHVPGEYTSSSDSTTIFDYDSDIMNYLKNKTIARICKAGKFPRLDLGNNYELEAESNLDNARMNWYKMERRRKNQNAISYRDWW